jgi:dGTPase
MALRIHNSISETVLSRYAWQAREQQLLASYASHSINSLGRKNPEPLHPYRGPFQRDRDRILHSAAFRRLSGKMQVFTGDMGDYHRTRLTHTNEVTSLARTAGRYLKLNEDLIEALAMLHDIGHPPFGHCGEDALSECLSDDGGFSHNRFAMEIVEQLEQRHTSLPGLNLTFEVLAGQHHRSNKELSPGEVTPLLEVQVVDAADSIAYDAHDVDDALKLGLISFQQLHRLSIVRRALEHAGASNPHLPNERQFIVHALLDLQIDDFLEMSTHQLSQFQGLDSQAVREIGILLKMSPAIESEKEELEDFLFESVYRHPRLMEIRLRAATRLRQMFHLLVAYPQRLPKRFQSFIEQQDSTPHTIRRVVSQYLAGMTDRFCDDTYVNLIELGRSQAEDWS